MHGWRDRLACKVGITAIDFETTGAVAGWPVEPWQLGLVALRDGRVDSDSLLRYWIQIASDRPFNPYAPGRHQQVRTLLAEAPTFPDVWCEIASDWLLGKPLAAHNIGTERTLLRRAAPLHRLGPWIDTLALARRVYPGLTDHGLDAVIATLGLEHRVRAVCPEGAPHDAGYDACACAVFLEHLLALPGWEKVTLGALCTSRIS